MIHPIERMTHGRLIRTAKSYAELDAYIEGVLKRGRVMFDQDSFHVDVMAPERSQGVNRSVELTGHQASDVILSCISYSFPDALVEVRERENAIIIEMNHYSKPKTCLFSSVYGTDVFVIRSTDAMARRAPN